MRPASALAALVTGLAACSGSHPATPSRTVAMGPDLTANLSADGRLTIVRAGKTILATAPGAPLLSRAVDDTSPSTFHNPQKLASVTLTPVADAAIAIESPAPGVLHIATTDDGAATVLMSLALASDGGFYTGLGERYDHVDPRGQVVGMQLELDLDYESGTTDRHVPVPWIVSSRGYGVFVASREAGAWDVASSDPAVVRSTFEGKTMDVTIVVDPDPLAVVAALATRTGLARRTPMWALAPMMWRHVDSQPQLLADLAKIRALHIPTSTFWVDDGWQTALDTFDFDPQKYTDPAAAAQTMSALGFKLLAWTSPYLSPKDAQPLYAQASAGRYFVQNQDGTPFAAPGVGGKGYGLVDFTFAAARAFWAGLAAKPIGIGMDGFKLDYGEDLVPDLLGARLGLKLADGETERTARTYPLGYQGAYRDALARTGDGGVLIVRASTYGGASVADIVWPGDLDNGFEHYGDPKPNAGGRFVGGLPASVVAAQTLAASGFPLYGADTAGYRGGAPTKESLLRWAEHTSLSMVMQLGPGESKYPWGYDAETTAIYTALANLHQKLVPYLYGELVRAQTTGTPTIRPLPLAFPDDADAVAAADDEYLLGPALLVAPVVTAGASSRSVHVPPGTWFSWWDGSKVVGPTATTVAAPLGQPPLYARAGSVVPLLPDGIDTLVASTDPGTVSIDAKAGVAEARAWVSGAATTAWPDGSTLAIEDVAAGVVVHWVPGGGGRAVTLTLALSARTGKAAPLTQVTALTGGALVAETSDAAVSGASTSAYFLAGDHAVVRLDGASDVRIE